MKLRDVAKLVAKASEEIELLSCGDNNMLDNGWCPVGDIAELLSEIQTIAQICEDETGRRFTRLTDSELEDMVKGWADKAEKVDEQHGEV